MKSRMLISIFSKAAWVLPIVVICMVGACKKYNYLGFTPGTGAPTITSVHTLTKADTVNVNDTLIAYNSSGDTTQTIRTTQTTTIPFDSATTAGNLGAYYVIEGTNLGSATSVTFNGATAYFNRALITDNSIIVAVPSTTPYFGPQATDSLTVTTTHGAVSYKFTILPPAPTVSSYSDFDFTSTGNFQMTLKGVGFSAVTAVTLQGTLSGTSPVNIVSTQGDTVLVLSFPSTSITRGTLAFSYNSGGTTLTAIGNQELVNVDAAYQVFALSNVAPGWGSWSYDNAGVSNKQAGITGVESYNMQFSGPNGYKVDGLRYESGTAAVGVTYSPSITYLVFYVYGGVNKETMYVEFGGGPGGGFANSNTANAINAVTVLPGQWNYFKIPISSLLWNSSATNWAANSSQLLNTVGFFIWQNTVTEELYFDDILLVN
jgi:hypothetical protein